MSENIPSSANAVSSGASADLEDRQGMPSQQTSTASGTNARNISAQEIQREMATLRSLRRRSASSVGPGALSFDPDLPPPASLAAHSTSPPKGNPYMHQHQHYRLHADNIESSSEPSGQSPTSPVSPSRLASSSSQYNHVSGTSDHATDRAYQLPALEHQHESEFAGFPQSHELDPDKPIMAQGEARLAGILPSAPSDDPRHLYWVPASLHPELAPTEFRAFLKAHAHTDTGDQAGTGAVLPQGLGPGSESGLTRSPSWLARAGANGTGMVADLARRSSTLRDGSARLPNSGLGSTNSAASAQGVPSLAVGGSLSRKRSMLSRQYHPRPNDDVENEPPPLPLHRDGSISRSLSRSSPGAGIYGGAAADQGVTLEDLQKLESIADEAAESGDPAIMRSLLKRSLSLNFSTDFVEGHPDVAQILNEEDSPILLTQTGSIMRRNAGTRRIRDRGSGVGSRLASSRRSKGRDVMGGLTTDNAEPTSPSGSQSTSFGSRLDERVAAPPASPVQHRDTFSDDRRRRSVDSDSDEMYSAEGESVSEMTGALPPDDRRPSTASTEDSSIYDAYASTDTHADTSVESSVSSTSYSGMDSSSEDHHGRANKADNFSFDTSLRGLMPAHYVQPEQGTYPYEAEPREDEGQRTPTSQVSEDFARFRIVGEPTQQRQPLPQAQNALRSTVTPPSPPETVKSQVHAASEKLASVAQYQQPQKQTVVQETPVSTRPALKVELAPPPSKLLKTKQSTEKLKVKSEKRGGLFSKNKDKDKKNSDKKEEKGFLGSLFGSKKKHEDTTPSKFSQEGKATAAALLGTSKSAKSLGLIPMRGSSPTSPGLAPYARYPIHVERAVYRLSHIKLANPRRPLYEQVLISNLMFWYLSIINKPVVSPSPQSPSQKETPGVQSSAENEKAAPALSRPPIARNATPAVSSAINKSVAPSNAPDSGARRTSLSKPEQRGSQTRPRSAETPVRSPQYGMQNLQMQQEYTSRGSPPQRSAPAQQPAPEPTSTPQLTPNVVPPLRRQALPHPINTNVPLATHQLPPRSPQPQPQSQPVYENNHQTHLPTEKPRRTSHTSGSLPVMENGRRPLPDRTQQHVDRSHDAPYHEPPPLQYQLEPERRESPRPRQGYSSHSGPQPGQVFQYPSAMLNIKPGQVFPSGNLSPVGTQPGQVFQHPQYNAHYTAQSYEQPEARLPPGAINPRQSSHDKGWNAGPHLAPPLLVGPKGSNYYDQGNARRATSGGEPYYNEYSGSPQQGSPRSVSASAVTPHDPRSQQTRHGLPGGPSRTPSPQLPGQNLEQNYAFRQPIPGHHEARR